MEADLLLRLESCERANQRLRRWHSIQLAVLVICIGVMAGDFLTARYGAVSAATKSLRVSEIVVADPQGVERVRIGGDLPDAVVGGKRTPRGAKAAGVLLYDSTGEERGGYVTWEPAGNVGLTLDTKLGQAALFVADRDSGTALRLWHGNDVIELRSDDDGSRLTAVKAGRIVVQQPDVSMSTEACRAYKEAQSRLSHEQVLNECRRRFSDAACGLCIGE